MKRFSKIASLVVAGTMILSLSACGGTKTETKTHEQTAQAEGTKAEAKKEAVKIKYPTYRLGTNVAAPAEKKFLDGFKAKFGNEVDVQVEEIPSDQAYVDKMKILISSGDVPDIIDVKNGIKDLLVKANLAVDLNEYFNTDAQWKSYIGQAAIDANTIDGKVVSASTGKNLVGYFYNKEMFDKAGIKPAATWDEFMSNCEALKKARFTPLALMTGENAWTTNLIFGSIIGTSGDAGNKFMNSSNVKDYNNPDVVKGLTMIQKMLKDYTTKDALGAVYANAANNFLQGKAAIIANGPWMIDDFSNKEKAPEGFDKKVGVAAYPGTGLYALYEEGYAICSKDKERKDAAAKFLKYRTSPEMQALMLEQLSVFPLSSEVKMTEEFKKNKPLAAELVALSSTMKYGYKFLDQINYPNVTDSFQKLYPQLALDKITPKEMAKQLAATADKNK